MKKFWLITVFVLAIMLLFVMVGCDNLKMDDDSEVGLTIDGVYNFTASGTLTDKKTFSSSQEIASTIETVSGGMVTANTLAGCIVVEGSAVYKINLTELPSDVEIGAYIEEVERDYLASFEGWKSFPNAPVKYTTKDGKDVLVFLDYDRSGTEISIFVLYFEAGSVDEIAAYLEGGQGENGNVSGGDNGSSSGNGSIGQNGSYVDGGKTDGEGGKIGGDGSVGGDDNGNGNGDGSVGGDGDGIGGQGTTSEVTWYIYDVDSAGEESLYMSSNVRIGAPVKFDCYDYVVFYDKEFKEEVNPNAEIKMERDLVVYRRDFLQKSPVFVTIHHIINGIEAKEKLEHFTFYRGKIVNETANTRGGMEYALYRDGGKGEYLFANGAIVIHDEDDKANWYAFRDDPLYHKVTFMVGESALGTTLIYDGTSLGEYSASALAGRTEYRIKACTGFDTPVTRDMVVTITDYQRIDQFPITLNLCYGGEVKYVETLYVPTFSAEEEGYEIGEGMGYYTDINFTEPFDGFIKTAHTFYIRIPVDLD